jgi:hypothetical protein
MTLVYTGHRGHDLARRAVAALEAVVVDESLLHGMQLTTGGRKSLYRPDCVTLRSESERQAGEHALAIDMDSASAALTVVAPFFGARQVHVLTQRVEK